MFTASRLIAGGLAFAGSVLFPLPARAAVLGELAIDAGAVDRRQTVAQFTLPASMPAAFVISDENGREVPHQMDRDRNVTLIIPELAKGKRAVWSVASVGKPAGEAAVRVTELKGAFELKAGSRTVLRYQTEKEQLPRTNIQPAFKRGGYLHPVYTPSGRQVTDDYPANHVHHHGIWFPWTKTEFKGRKPDFWNMGANTGTVEFEGVDEHWNGPVYGGFTSRHRFVDLTVKPGETVLREQWEVRVYRSANAAYSMFDLRSTQECAGPDPLILPQYHYGGLGFRGNWNWNGKDNTSFLTSEGITNRLQGNESRGRWCYIGGQVDGATAGIVILGHPSNYRFPQPMRLHPTEPFFCFAPQQLGEMRIEPGTPYRSRYRFIAVDGLVEREAIERMFEDYSNPPVVTLTVKR